MYRSLFLFQFICVGSLLCGSLPEAPKCKLNDSTCTNNLANTIYHKAVAGNAELGIESLTPLHQEKIEGDLSIIKYTLRNVSCYGFEKCSVENLQYTPGSLKMNAEFTCPYFELKGEYEINGQLIVIPIEGKGPFVLKANDYVIKMETELKKTTGKDGKNYIAIKKYNITPELRGYVDFDMQNLFNGREDLAAPAMKFIKDNYKAVALLLQGPVFDANIKKIVKNMNKVMKQYPMEDVTQP